MGWRNGLALVAHLEDQDLSLRTPMAANVTPAPWDPAPSSGLHWYCMHIVHRYTSRQNNSYT